MPSSDPKTDIAGHRPVRRGQVDRAEDARGSRLGGRRQSPALAAQPSAGDAAAGGSASATRPLALGLDSRTRGFDAERIVKQIKRLGKDYEASIETLYLDCQTPELLRRYSETRRRHPLAPDRPAIDGIAEEREMMAPLKRWADHVVDTTDSDSNLLRQQIRDRFGGGEDAPTLALMSFGFARGVPRNADLVFDMRFLRNPHWEKELRDLTGLDQAVGDHIAGDAVYERGAGPDRGAAAHPSSPLSGRRKILCLGRVRLYRRETPLGPCRGASRGTVACGGFFAHGGPSRPRHAATRRYRAIRRGKFGSHRGGRRLPW